MKPLSFLWLALHSYAVQAYIQRNIQVKVFANDSFSLEYGEYPIYLEESSEVFIEMKATKKRLVAIPKECYVSGYQHRNHHPSLGYELIKEHCTTRRDSYHLPAQDKAARFRFVIRQFFGVSNQFLFLHCKVTTCKRDDVPPSSAFRCGRQKRAVIEGHCLHQKEKNITTGPFTVWPEWLEPHQKPSLAVTKEDQAKGPTSLNTLRAAQVKIFANSSYKLEYEECPINIESYRKVFIEVKATNYNRVAFPEECHLSIFKNRSLGHSSMRHRLIEENCEMQFDVYYLKTHNKAVRFRFVIEQFFGVTGQPLYLHCLINTCQRNDAPQPTVFDCHTHGQYCPSKKKEYVTKGPFVVWPVASKRDRYNLKIQKDTKPKFFPPSPSKSIAEQDNELSEDMDSNIVRLGLASPEFVAPGFFTLGVTVTVIILFIYKQIKKTNRAKKEQDESANEEEI